LGGWIGGSGAVRAASAVVLLYIPTPNSTCGERRKDPSPVPELAGMSTNGNPITMQQQSLHARTHDCCCTYQHTGPADVFPPLTGAAAYQ